MDTATARELFKAYLYRRYGDRSTPKHYLSDLSIFLAHIGDKSLHDVTARKLTQGLTHYDEFPAWLREPLCAYTQYRWRSWQPHLAAKHLTRLTNQLSNTWHCLFAGRDIRGWTDLQRSDIEAWLDVRRQARLTPGSQYTELGDLRAFLQFVHNHEHPVNANLFRVAAPVSTPATPKHLSEPEYKRLLATVLSQTADNTLSSVAERAWFLTLAHTGLRVSELLNLRLGDLDLTGARISSIRRLIVPWQGQDCAWGWLAVGDRPSFPIKVESLRLGDFNQDEVNSLLNQHTHETSQAFAPDALELVWQFTNGQPWLVNALAYEACFRMTAARDRSLPITARRSCSASSTAAAAWIGNTAWGADAPICLSSGRIQVVCSAW